MNKNKFTDNNYHDDAEKIMLGLVRPEFVEGIGKILTYGAKKYKKDSWKQLDNGIERYTDSLYRHLIAYQKGEYIDPESSMPHLLHLATNCMFIHYLETQQRKGETDE